MPIYPSIDQYVNSGFTIVNGICACANLSILVAIILAVVSTDSIVHPAMCGISMKLSSFNNLSLGSGGSSQNTSNAAPDILLLESLFIFPLLSEGLFKKVGAVILLVSDMEKSVKFYRDVLRLPIKSQSEGWTEFFNSGTVIALHPRRKAKVNPGIGVLVGFMVTDLDDIVNKLKQQGVKFFKEPKEEPFGKHTILEDPDGHLISIAQIESKSAEGFDLLGFLIDMGVDIQE